MKTTLSFVARVLNRDLAHELGRCGAVGLDSDQGHRGGHRAECAQADQKHALVLLPDDGVPALRQGQAEVARPAIADRHGEARVGGGEVTEERRRGTNEGTDGLRAGTGCAGARVLVLRGAVVDDVVVAPELPVRQRTLAASRKASSSPQRVSDCQHGCRCRVVTAAGSRNRRCARPPRT